MPTCPNCNYELVLLSNRQKYKCPLCSRLYPQREIDNKTFREWNKNKRELELHNLNLELMRIKEEKLRKEKLIELNKLRKSLRILFNGQRQRLNLTSEERKIVKKEYNRKWNNDNPDKVKAMRRRRLKKHREKVYSYLKEWRKSNLNKSRMKQRLTYWRGQQAKLVRQELAVQGFKIIEQGVYK